MSRQLKRESVLRMSRLRGGAFLRAWHGGTRGPHSVRAQGLVLRGFVECLELEMSDTSRGSGPDLWCRKRTSGSS